MAEYTLYNSIEQIDRTISGAYYALIVAGTGLPRVVPVPSTSTSAGVSGYNIAFDGTYFYGCTGENKWGRVQLSTF
jgi:hypothetical protein